MNPRIVVEVISRSSERSDRGEKFTRYRLLESLQEYILVSQEKPQVEAYFRQPDGTWLFSPYFGMEAIVPCGAWKLTCRWRRFMPVWSFRRSLKR